MCLEVCLEQLRSKGRPEPLSRWHPVPGLTMGMEGLWLYGLGLGFTAYGCESAKNRGVKVYGLKAAVGVFRAYGLGFAA